MCLTHHPPSVPWNDASHISGAKHPCVEQTCHSGPNSLTRSPKAPALPRCITVFSGTLVQPDLQWCLGAFASLLREGIAHSSEGKEERRMRTCPHPPSLTKAPEVRKVPGRSEGGRWVSSAPLCPLAVSWVPRGPQVWDWLAVLRALPRWPLQEAEFQDIKLGLLEPPGTL